MKWSSKGNDEAVELVYPLPGHSSQATHPLQRGIPEGGSLGDRGEVWRRGRYTPTLIDYPHSRWTGVEVGVKATHAFQLTAEAQRQYQLAAAGPI